MLGEGLAPLAGGDRPGWRSVPLPPGQPLTGVWRELAAWSAGPGRGSLVIADYDPGLRYLCLAAFAGRLQRLTEPPGSASAARAVRCTSQELRTLAPPPTARRRLVAWRAAGRATMES